MDGFAGAVLTGGASRRMGRDKALVPLGRRPLVRVAADALRAAGAAPIVMVGGDLSSLAELGLHGIADLHPAQGPLGGLLTTLTWAPKDVVVVLSCDLVAIGAHEVAALVAALCADPRADVAAPLVDGRPQYLTAAYRRCALGPLQVQFDRGERAVRRAIAASGLQEHRVGDLDPRRLTDVDTPEALRHAAGSVCHLPGER